MTVYLMPKSRLISKATNFRPKQWTTNWIVVKRPFSKSQAQYGSTNNQKAGGKGGWLQWQGTVLRWTPLGVALMAAAQWHFHNRECERKGLPRTAPHWQTTFYCSLPLRIMSRGWGWIAERNVPEALRPSVYGLYSTAFGVNLEEAVVADFKHYRSLSEFFTRSIREDCRCVAPDSVVSPCDGKVLHLGPVHSDTHLEQIKGVTYTLEAFLGPKWSDKNGQYIESIKQRKEGTALFHCIIYLAPGDYHRFHSPADWKPVIRRHFHGELLSVSPKVAKWVPGLFCLNERATYIGEWEHGFFSFTAVGATNVGSVQVYVDEDLKTNRWRGLRVGKHVEKDCEEVRLRNDLAFSKGELVGQFNMGSTIVLVFEAPKTFRFNLTPGQTVRLGQKLGSFSDDEADSGVESEE